MHVATHLWCVLLGSVGMHVCRYLLSCIRFAVCSLTGRLGAKLLDGSVAYSATELRPDQNIAKPADLEPASEPQRLPPGLFPRSQPHQLHRSRSQSNSLTQVPAVGAASVRRSLLGGLQAGPSSQSDQAPQDTSPATNSACPVPWPATSAPPPALDEDLNDDDAFDAICSLDALLAPSSPQRPTPHLAFDLRDSREHDQRQGSPYTRPSPVRAHTSTAHRSSPEGQTGSPHTADSRRSAAARSTGLGLWTAGQQTAAEAAAAAAPMRILKRPVIPDQQAVSTAVSPPLAPKLAVSASVCKASSASALMLHSALEMKGGDVSPASASLREEADKSKSSQECLPSQQGTLGSSSSDGSTSEAPAAATVSPFDTSALAKSNSAHRSDPSASDLHFACGILADSSSRHIHDPHHSSPAQQSHEQLLPAEGSQLGPPVQVGL